MLELYDDIKAAVVLEIEFFCPIARVQLRREAIVTLTTEKLHFHSLTSPPQLLYEHTVQATLLTISILPGMFMVGTETHQPGQIQLLNVCNLLPISTALSSSSTKTTATPHSSSAPSLLGIHVDDRVVPHLPSSHIHLFKAHHSTVKAMTMTSDGTKLVSASDRGTLVRVWDTHTTHLLHEFRRGVDTARLYSMMFNTTGTRLVVSSDKGTIHIFNMPTSLTANTKSQFSFLTPWFPTYFGSEWSFASFRVPFYHDGPHLQTPWLGVCFLKESEKVFLCSEDGRLLRFVFDIRRGGECIGDGSWQLDWESNESGPILEIL
ncbi:hypothetical protein HMI55_000607 [Coelomomyces lativittatus]|nr:hypothetical protein HMI55_000607 [Coelomomyces lativittatus]